MDKIWVFWNLQPDGAASESYAVLDPLLTHSKGFGLWSEAT